MNLFAIFGVGGLVLTVLLGIQTGRLSHAKKDLTEARAAQVDPATGKRWADEYRVAAVNLNTCRGNAERSDAAIKAQNSALEGQHGRDVQSLARAGEALQAARKSSAAAQSLVADLSRPIVASETCSAMLEIDSRFLKGRL